MLGRRMTSRQSRPMTAFKPQLEQLTHFYRRAAYSIWAYSNVWFIVTSKNVKTTAYLRFLA